MVAEREVYTARRGQGAQLDGMPIHVSPVSTLAEATVAHGTLRILRRRGRWNGFERLVDAKRTQRGFGDFLCYAWLAAGTALDGRDSLTSGAALASNGRLHDAALRVLAPC
jgi:histidinol-phosphatase